MCEALSDHVGHYRRTLGRVQEECGANSSWTTARVDANWGLEFVRSNGCPTAAAWRTPNARNVARHQACAFVLPHMLTYAAYADVC